MRKVIVSRTLIIQDPLENQGRTEMGTHTLAIAGFRYRYNTCNFQGIVSSIPYSIEVLQSILTNTVCRYYLRLKQDLKQ